MTNVTDWANARKPSSYDLASHMTSITRPNGTYRTIGYDAAGQATNILEQMAQHPADCVVPVELDKLRQHGLGICRTIATSPMRADAEHDL